MVIQSSTATADPPRFRATPLVKLNFLPLADINGTMGINNKGQVVYGYVPSGGGDMRAWIWLPVADSSYDPPSGLAAGFHDLTSLMGAPTPAIARDINQAGDVAGSSSGMWTTRGPGDATIWRLGTSDPPIILGDFGGSDGFSAAQAISDHSPPFVAGDARATRNCECPPVNPADEPVTRGFYAELTSSSPTLVELISAGQSQSFARDINTLPSSQFVIVGQRGCSGGPSAPVQCFQASDGCENGAPSSAWSNPASPIDVAKLSANGADVLGVNNNNACAGYSRVSGIFPACRRHAVYWSTPASAVFDLGAIMPSGQSTHASVAVAINNLTSPQVVGWNIDQNKPLLWDNTGGSSWTVLDLTTTEAIGTSNSRYALWEGHDINDNGWIITWGVCSFSNSALNGRYAVLLTPFPEGCIADLADNDQDVNINDLLVVIGAWGECPIGSFCTIDIDGSGSVDIGDLLTVIGEWGPCGESGGGAPDSVEDCESTCAQAYPGGGLDYAECVEKCVTALCESQVLPPEDCP